MDRVRAARLAVKCMQHLEDFAGKSSEEVAADEMSLSVIGIKGTKVVFGSMKDLEMTDTDWKARRPKNKSWLKLKATVDILSGRP